MTDEDDGSWLLDGPRVLVNKTELSRLTGFSIGKIDRLTRDGMPATRTGSRGSALQYSVPDCITWLIEQERAAHASGTFERSQVARARRYRGEA